MQLILNISFFMKHLIDTVNSSLQKKLKRLVSFLSQIARGFDIIAEEIDNASLKTAILTISTESKQYAKEIANGVQTLNISINEGFTAEHHWKRIELSVNEETMLAKGGEIAALCNNCEMYFSKLYEDVLDEYFPHQNLKDIVTYQLFAIRCAFMKIRLLNTQRFQ